MACLKIKGLEFIAARDIEQSLESITILHEQKYSWEKKTGYVHLFCTVDNLKTFKDDLANKVQLLSIYSVTLVASQSIIPASTLSEIQPTCDFFMQQTKNAPWHSVIDEKDDDSISFRATFKKGQIKHKASTQQIAGVVGFAFSDFFKQWKVKMIGFDYEILSLWFQTTDAQILSRISDSNCNETLVVLLLGVTIPLKDQSQRNRVFVGRTSLNPCIAYCLARLVDPKPGQILLDMCCGTGTIPIEGTRARVCVCVSGVCVATLFYQSNLKCDLLGASHFKDVFWLGSESKSLASNKLNLFIHSLFFISYI